MKARSLFALMLTTMILPSAARLEAATPWSKMVPFKRVAANPQDDYPLTENCGPWVILASTFSGDGAPDQARSLVLELRSKYKLPAYTFKKDFDFSKPVQGRGIDRYGAPISMKHRRHEKVEEIAVLVGDYPSLNDPEAQRVLKKIKFLDPEALKVDKTKPTSQSLAALRIIQKSVLSDDNEQKKKGPMGQAFLITNPLLPTEYFVPKGIDKLVLEMNKGVKFSLLDCKKRYTVKVATFTGHVVLDQKKIEEIEKGRPVKSRLADAAEKAHQLTVALREKGFEAYEFHDRYSSMVTVGSFDSVGTPRSDGKIEINPQVHTIMTQFGPDTKKDPSKPAPRTLIGIPFDIQPMPVEVPQRSISSDYAG